MPKKTANEPSASTKRATRSKPRAVSDDGDHTPAPSKKKKPEKNSTETEEENNFKLPEYNFKKTKISYSFMNYYRNYQMGFSCEKYRKSVKDLVIKYCQTFQIYKTESPFNRRVTYIVWHPTNPRLLAVTSHWGDIILYDYEKDLDLAPKITGVGAGGSVQGMKFDPGNPLQIYVASMQGKFLIFNFHTKEGKSFLVTNDINRWFVSVDVNSSNSIVVAGDTRGNLSVLTPQGEVILDQVQLHKKGSKITHAEFSKREPWLLCTSSTDSTIKLWDIRSLKPEKSGMSIPLQTITHKKPLNAAYFSLTNGCRLLTTDQCDKIYIYRAPLWDLETVIRHPHRQFQHLTPIKAYWHPLEDIVFVGRYPHNVFPGFSKDELRTIDFFDADTGEMLHQHYQVGCNGILPLNRFNVSGDTLASSYGCRFMIWKPNFKNMLNLNLNERKDCDSKEEVDWEAVMKKQMKDRRSNTVSAKKKIETVTELADGKGD